MFSEAENTGMLSHTHMTHSAYCPLQSNWRQRKNLQLQKHSNLSTSPLLHLVLPVFRWEELVSLWYHFRSWWSAAPSTVFSRKDTVDAAKIIHGNPRRIQTCNYKHNCSASQLSTCIKRAQSGLCTVIFLWKNGQQMLPIDNSFSVIDFFPLLKSCIETTAITASRALQHLVMIADNCSIPYSQGCK